MELSPFLYGLYKLAKYAIYPYSWFVLLAGLMAVLACFPPSAWTTRWMRRAAFTVFGLLLLLGNSWVSHLVMGTLEAWHPPVDPATLSKSDYIVVLGGGIDEKGTLRPTTDLSAVGAERVRCGIDLYKRGLAPTVVMSGGDARVFGEGVLEAPIMKEFAVRDGVPASAVAVEDRSRTTYENLAHVRQLIGPGASLILVTSAYHMPRAYQLAAHQGLRPILYPCGYHTRNLPSWSMVGNLFDLIPNSTAFWHNSVAISEITGILVYKLVGKA